MWYFVLFNSIYSMRCTYYYTYEKAIRFDAYFNNMELKFSKLLVCLNEIIEKIKHSKQDENQW